MRKIDQILDYADEKLNKICEERNIDWNAMNDQEKIEFINEIVNGTFNFKGDRGPRGRMGPRGPRGQKGNPG